MDVHVKSRQPRMMGGGFRSIHPLPCFLYYAGIMMFSMLLFHPIFLLTSLCAMAVLNVLHDGGKELRRWTGYFTVTGLVIVLVNPLFSHRGAHMLFYLFDNPITLESIIYGFTMMLSILTILVAFVSYNQMIPSAKFVYLFSGISPKLTLLLVISLRFVPLLQKRLQQISIVQRSRGINILQGTLGKRIKDGMKQLQILLTWSLEEALQTADSMSSRGYGLGKRSSYEAYSMELRDWLIMLTMVIATVGCLIGWYGGFGVLTIYPAMEHLYFHRMEWLYYGFFCVFLMIPIFLEGREKLRWRKLR